MDPLPPTAARVQCVNLACRLVHEHFGKSPALVADVLLRKGRQTFPELLRAISSGGGARRQLDLSTLAASGSSYSSYSNSRAAAAGAPVMTAALLKQVLMALIQQNCVTTCLQPPEVLVTGVRPAVTIYEADLNQMLQIIRRPKFMQLIRDESEANPQRRSNADVLIVDALLRHGRMRYDQILEAVHDQIEIGSGGSNGGAGGEEGGGAAAAAAGVLAEQTPTQQVWWAFQQLIQERYIERAPPANLPPLPPTSLAPTKTKKAATKPGTHEYAEAQARLAKQQLHQQYEEGRFKPPPELFDVAEAAAGAAAAAAAADARRRTASPAAPAGGAADSDDDDDDAPLDAGAAAAQAARAAAEAASSKKGRKRKQAGGQTEDAVAASAAEAAAAAASERAAAAKQKEMLKSKRRKGARGEPIAADAAAAAAAAAGGVVIKVEAEDDVSAPAAAAAAGGGRSRAAPAAAAAALAADVKPEDDGLLEAPPGGQVLWRINTQEFNRRLRNKVLMALTAERLGQDAAIVLGGMLHECGGRETRLATDVSVAMTLPEVMSGLRAAQGSGRLAQLRADTTVQDQLEALKYDAFEIVSAGQAGLQGETYVVNIGTTLYQARLQQLNAVLRDKFGERGMRVYNTLLAHGQLEPKQIADFIMREHKEARELLYRMFKAGYLQMQDIPRTADRAPSRCFYTFKADPDHTFKRTAADMYQAADNLHARMAYEMAQHTDLLDLIEVAQATGTLNFNMTEAQKRTLHALSNRVNALQLSLLRLDDMLALFTEYAV